MRGRRALGEVERRLEVGLDPLDYVQAGTPRARAAEADGAVPALRATKIDPVAALRAE